MRVSLDWLSEYVTLEREPPELAENLLNAGLEVGSIEDLAAGMENIFVAELLTVAPHPNADRLSVCDVQALEKTHQIVCGAKNMKPGDRVALALPGARLPNGLEIKKSKIRGEVSEGMLVSEKELGISDESAGIMILPADATVDAPLADYLDRNDTILDIELTPNRADCLSHVGVAREIGAITGAALRFPSFDTPEEGDTTDSITSVNIDDPERCPRYAARIIRGVKVEPSPDWLAARLEKVGVRPINNVVDVTNYVLFELGQPLHAFDLATLAGQRIVVRCARPGEALITLDGVERKLDPDDLVIGDAERPVAIAGVMGGEATEVHEGTTDILLESAYFTPGGIRRTARRHGLKTEASHRFERGCDPEMVVRASNRVAALLAKLTGGHVASGVLDVYPAPVSRSAITLDPSRASALLGIALSADAMVDFLRRLGIQANVTKGRIEAAAPSWRPDLGIDVDLIEEVARLYGYDRIPVTLPRSSAQGGVSQPIRRIETAAREVFTGFGFYEAITYRFVSPDWPDRLNLESDDPRRSLLRLRNPLREDQAAMRTSLIPGLLLAALGNVRGDHANVRLFEVGKIFFDRSANELPEEILMLGAVLCGDGRPGYWGKGTPADFYDAKGVVEALLDRLSVQGARFVAEGVSPYLHPGFSARVQWEKGRLGELGCIHPGIAAALELPENLYLVDLSVGEVLGAAGAQAGGFRPLPRFPAARRDIAVVVEDRIEAGELVRRIRSIPEGGFQAALREIQIFDVYRGEGIPAGKKSIALRLAYRSDQRTLTDSEVSAFQDRVLSRLAEEFGAELRN